MSGRSDTLEIRPLRGRAMLRDWLAVPHRVFDGDPAWIAPLDLQERQRISPRHNPFFAFGTAEFFLAYRGGQPMGRISAQINRRHLDRHGDRTGHFGFFDCLNDSEAAEALVAAAAHWLKSQGMARMLGPMNLHINEDIGLLVSGFEEPPAILSSHAPRWAGRLLEDCGLDKEMDLFAYRTNPNSPQRHLERLAKLALSSGRITVRKIDLSNYERELQLFFDIFNDAWSDNWGFVPVGPEEVKALGKEMRPILREKFGRIAYIDGEPAAMMVVLPDLNRAIASFEGKLLPFNWARLAHALWADRWKTARIPLLGIRKQHRGKPIAAGVLSLLVSDFMELGRGYDLDWVEFSWVLEINREMVMLGELAAGKPVRTYRIYSKALK